MLQAAARALPSTRVTLVQQDLGAPLPEGPFDLVVSALAIHHLDGPGKTQLFRAIRQRLAPGGTFVMGDVIAPVDPSDALIENEAGYDFPDTLEDQVRWMAEGDLVPEVCWIRKDLAVVRAKAGRD
jgi:SAM-dependent methyltransferase